MTKPLSLRSGSQQLLAPIPYLTYRTSAVESAGLCVPPRMEHGRADHAGTACRTHCFRTDRPFSSICHCAGITNSARSLAGRDGCWIRRSLRLGDDVIAVHRVDGVIAVSVKYNGRNGAFDPAGCSRKIRPALPHSCECRGNVAGGATRQSRVDTDGRIKVWVSSSHYCSCGTSSRQPGDIHAPRFDTEVAHDLAGNARKERWLSLIALQISSAKPVPALKGIRRLGLRRIGDQDRAPAMMCSPTAPELVPSNIVRGAQMGIRQCCNS
jgi:hypothetical protein